MSNLPDDWGSFWSTCPHCGERYHESGTDPCSCEVCVVCREVVHRDEVIEVDGDPVCPRCYANTHDEEEVEEEG